MKTLLLAATLVTAISTPKIAAAATLVSQYQFSNAGNLGLDSTANHNDANVVANVSQVAGPQPGTIGAQFDQSSQFRIGPLTGYAGNPGFALSAWVYVDGTNGGYNGVISQDAGGCCSNRLLLLGSSASSIFTNIGAHNDDQTASTISTQVWHHIVMTAANSSGGAIGQVYVDGILFHTRTVDALPDMSSFSTYLGAGENGDPYRLNGILADVRIYQGALTSGDVTALYNAGAGAGAVPEPATWAMLIAGFGVVGAAQRRRRPVAVAA